MKHHLDDLRLSNLFDSNPAESDVRYLKWREASQPASDSFDKRTNFHLLHNDRSFSKFGRDTSGIPGHGRKKALVVNGVSLYHNLSIDL